MKLLEKNNYKKMIMILIIKNIEILVIKISMVKV
jgi:hypothetical protein